MLVNCVVTRLPPAIDGVGDYALNLARKLRQNLGIETHFIVGDPGWAGETEIEGFAVSKIDACSTDAVASLLLKCSQKSNIFLLHYVGHGYAARGCPVWLIQGLERWKKNVPDAHLVTMFHELYAFGPPWRSAFWLSLLQKNLASRVALLSDRCLTSVEGYAKKLHNLSQGKHTQIPTLPVFSNIGEPSQVFSLSERHRRLVVFGQEKSKIRVYQESLAALKQACQILEIEEIWDIGPATGINLARIGSKVPVIEIGELSTPEISEIMLDSIAGFFNYDTTRLAKSGIFAAYCSHGLIPIAHEYSPLAVDGIEAGKHYWTPQQQELNINFVQELQEIADNAYTWYQSHNVSAQAKTFAAYLKND